MGLFDKIKNALSKNDRVPPVEENLVTEENSFEMSIKIAVEEYKKTAQYFYNEDLNKIATWTENVKSWPDKKKIAFVYWLVPGIHNYSSGNGTVHASDSYDYQVTSIKEAFLKAIFKSKLLMDEVDVTGIYECFRTNCHKYRGIFGAWPVGMMIQQIANQYGKDALPEPVKQTLLTMKEDIEADQNYYFSKERAKLAGKIDTIIFAGSNISGTIKPAYFVGDDRFAAFANPLIKALPEKEQNGWFQVLAMAQKVSGAKPTQKYLDAAKVIIKEAGSDKYKATLQKFL